MTPEDIAQYCEAQAREYRDGVERAFGTHFSWKLKRATLTARAEELENLAEKIRAGVLPAPLGIQWRS